MNKIVISLIFITLLIFPVQVFADPPTVNIPPTNAYAHIKTLNGTANATYFDATAEFQGLRGIKIFTGSNGKIYFNATLANGTGGGSGTITPITCSLNYQVHQVIVVANVTSFVCAPNNSTKQTLNTMQNLTPAQSYIYAKNNTNFNFQFRGINATGSLLISNSSTLVTIHGNIYQNNTGANLGTLGTGVYSGMSGSVLQFFKLISTNNLLSISSNSTNIILTVQHVISDTFKAFTSSCAVGTFFSSFSNTTGIFTCTQALTQINNQTGTTLSLLRQQGNTTITNSSNHLTVGIGPNVATGGLNIGKGGAGVFKQIITGQLQLRNFTSINTNYTKIKQNATDININSTVPVLNVVDIYDQTIGDYTTPTKATTDTGNTHLDGSTTCNNSIRTWCTITVGTNANRLMIFQFVHGSNTTGSTPSINNVKDNGATMTKLTNQTGTAGGLRMGEDIWYVLNPSIGLNNITFSWVRSSLYSEMGLISLYNINQTSPFNAASIGKTGGSNPATISQAITPTRTGSWILAGTATFQSATAPNFLGLWTNILDSRSQVRFSAQYDSLPVISSPNTFTWASALGSTGYSVIAYEAYTSSNSWTAPGLAVDGLLTTTFKGTNINPTLVLDSGSSQILSGLALYPDTTHTNATQILIQTSNDNSTWTTKRTVNMNAFVNATWQFVRWDLDTGTQRYIRVIGNDADNRQLAIVEAKILVPTSTALLLRHGHTGIPNDDATVPLNR